MAQQTTKLLTNDDIVAMVKNGLPESVILSAIQANDTNFDASASALIGLKKAGVSPKVMDAMLTAAANKKNAVATPPAQSASPNAPTTPSGEGVAAVASVLKAMPAMNGLGGTPGQAIVQPSVVLLQSGARTDLTAEKTFIAQTKAKATSLRALSADTALQAGLQAGMNQAWYTVATHTGAYAAQAVWDSSGILSGVLSHRKKPSYTYVWAISGLNSSTTAAENPSPNFEVNYSGIPGINPEEFEPAIVKLTPSHSAWRLVGATEAKSETVENSAPEWQIYSTFVEDRMPAQVKRLASGHAEICPASSLAPGEYAVVLRPISKAKKFSGTDVAANRGEGMLFNSVWSFEVK
jgi:hypothetical protein